MADYDTYTNEDDGVVLKKARAKSKGGMLTDTVRAGDAVSLPQALASYRERAADLYKQGADLYNAEPDMAQLQQYAKTRGDQGQGSMLNALAAQFAGESFQPVQAQYLKRAAAAQEPMKLAGGILTDQGQFIKDPFAQQDKRAEFLLQQAKAYEQMALNAQTAQERMAAEQQYKMIMAGIAGMNAQTNRMSVGPGGKAPSGYQWTTGEDGTPALTFIPGGPGDPAVKSQGQPTEDERKAAGWYFQADNARRNMAGIIAKNPGAAYPTVPERLTGLVPVVGGDIQNSLRPEDRQKFVQASGSMAEALLRAATGAGINAYEADQKVKELVPQLGDKSGTVKQKMDAYGVYMDSLKARAGRAIPSNNPGGPATPANNDPLGLRKPAGG